jgi:hypothetical protein
VTKVLYIGAWGRSGTTILDNVLDAYPHVFSAGELYFVWARGLMQGRRCGCGTALPECPLWTKVFQEAYGTRPPDPYEMVALQERIARVRNTGRLLRGLGGRGGPGAEDARRYQEAMTRLYDAIAAVTGAQLIVDSSKLPSGAASLVGADLRSYLVHMMRDPRAVAYSWQRRTRQLDQPHRPYMDRHTARESAVNWLAWNLLLERVALRYAYQLQLRYEDFVIQPRATVERVLALAGMSAQDGPFADDNTVQLSGNHSVSGNPSRFRTGRVEIRPDDAWRTAQSRRDRVVTTAITLPLLRRYGYPLW